MGLLRITILLFYIHGTISLVQKNPKRNNLSSLVRKARNFYSGLTTPPRGFLQERRYFPIPNVIQSKGREASFLRKPFGKEWKKLSRLRKSRRKGKKYQRSARRLSKHHRRRFSSQSGKESSTDTEMAQWKKSFNRHWLNLKKDALNEMRNSNTLGDVVNMVAARPWTVPCGDPEQHDWPWGSCTHPRQCDAEYRIYRGDKFCGRTSLVCCVLQYTNHDLYQGFDLSFVDTGSESTAEEQKYNIGSRRLRHLKRHRAKFRVWAKRRRTKRKLKKEIKIIVHRLRKALNRVYRNTTQARKRRLDELLLRIKKMKSKFRHERNTVLDKFDFDIDDIHTEVYKKLLQIESIYQHYLTNTTFKDYVKKFNISEEDPRLFYLAPKFGNQTPKLEVDGSAMAMASPERVKLLRANEKDLKDASQQVLYDGSWAENLSFTLDPNSLTKTSVKDNINPSIVVRAANSLPLTESLTTLPEVDSKMHRYKRIGNGVLEPAKKDTRRSGARLITQRKRNRKKPIQKDYLEYDIEYGKLYL